MMVEKVQLRGGLRLADATGYRTGEQPQRYGCRDYSLEMQLLQLKKRELLVTGAAERRQLEARISEIESQLGL
ncbi:MAG: hypothetical protein JXR80_05570 [Deltaproteobacteria bacterium]|nr:hypothetical protein [Deltaproteobacteria bacterium]